MTWCNFSTEKWSTSKRGMSLSCASGLSCLKSFRRSRENFPDGPSKNVKCSRFLFSFSHAHIEPNYGRLFPAVVDMDPFMCSNKGGNNRRERKENIFFGTTQAVGVRSNQIHVWVVVFSQGNKMACPVEFSAKLMFPLSFREACE